MPSWDNEALRPIPENNSVIASQTGDHDDDNAPRFSINGGPPSQRPEDGRSTVSDTHAELGTTGPRAPSEQSPQPSRGDSSDPRSRTSKSTIWFCCDNKKNRIYTTIVLIVLITLTVGIVVFLVRSDGNGNSSANKAGNGFQTTTSQAPTNTPSMENTTAPEPAPTLPPFTLSEDSEMPTFQPTKDPAVLHTMDTIISAISTSEALLDSSSPQSRCRQWMLDVDALDSTDLPDFRFEQRYILCVFFFSTGGNFVEETFDGRDSATENGWTISFLDQHTDECRWPRLNCDQDGKIVTISLKDKNLQGPLPHELLELSKLQVLNLKSNRLSGQLPTDLFVKLTSLIWFELAENNLSGPIPTLASGSNIMSPDDATSSLQALLLYDNSFTGLLPFYPNVKQLWVRSNHLAGFDARYTKSSTLEKFVAYDNNMTGTLHDDWDSANLQILDLSRNSWTGPLPGSLWDQTKLETVFLHNCQFEGPLPAGRAGNAFKQCRLQSNRLSGMIPEQWAIGWTNLTELLLNDNFLTGSIESNQCDAWKGIVRLETDCDENGTMTCACCTNEVCQSLN